MIYWYCVQFYLSNNLFFSLLYYTLKFKETIKCRIAFYKLLCFVMIVIIIIIMSPSVSWDWLQLLHSSPMNVYIYGWIIVWPVQLLETLLNYCDFKRPGSAVTCIATPGCGADYTLQYKSFYTSCMDLREVSHRLLPPCPPLSGRRNVRLSGAFRAHRCPRAWTGSPSMTQSRSGEIYWRTPRLTVPAHLQKLYSCDPEVQHWWSMGHFELSADAEFRLVITVIMCFLWFTKLPVSQFCFDSVIAISSLALILKRCQCFFNMYHSSWVILFIIHLPQKDYTMKHLVQPD